MRARFLAALAASGALALAVGCGGGEKTAPHPSGGSMNAQAAAVGKSPKGKAGEDHPPVVESVSLVPEQPLAGGAIETQVQGSDPDGDPVKFGYAWRVNGRPVRAASGTLPAGITHKGDTVEVRVTPNDGRMTGQSVTVQAEIQDRPPKIDSVTLQPSGNLVSGGTVSANVSARDADGDPISYHYQWLVNGDSAGTDSPTFSTKGLRRGDTLQVRVVATDGEQDSDPFESTPVSIINGAPEIVSKPSPVLENGVFHYALKVQDPDGDTVGYRLVKAPDGMTIDPVTGEITWRVQQGQTGHFAVEVAVDDRHGGTATQEFELNVSSEKVPPAKPGSAGGAKSGTQGPAGGQGGSSAAAPAPAESEGF